MSGLEELGFAERLGVLVDREIEWVAGFVGIRSRHLLSLRSRQPVLQATTAGGTANAPGDYTALPPSTFELASGVTRLILREVY